MALWIKRFASILAAAALAVSCAVFCAGCAEKPTYQAVVVAQQETPGDLFVVQSTNGAMTSGLIVLHLPAKCDADPAALKPGDLLDVYGSNQIAFSYPGQASATNIKLAGRVEGEAYAPFAAEWDTFAGRLAAR